MTAFAEQMEPTMTVKSGHAAIFNFPAISSEPSPSVSWQSDDLSLLYGTKYATTSDNRLVILSVDKSDQKLHLYENGLKKHSWEVSTARKGKVTPTGTWNAKWLSKYHKSSIYNNAPMPYSIFYNGNFAIHGTDQIGRLGTPASSGCVRLHPENAAVLYAMVERVGRSDFAVRVIE